MARDLLGVRTEIVGVQAGGAPSYALSFAAGRAVSTERPDALALILRGAARIVQVDDDAIAEAVRAYWTDTHNLAEGAGAAPLAAALQEREALRGRRVGLIHCGGNIDLALFVQWVVPAACPAPPSPLDALG